MAEPMVIDIASLDDDAGENDPPVLSLPSPLPGDNNEVQDPVMNSFLIPEEKIKFIFRQVTNRKEDGTSKRGSLYVTSFRLFFAADEAICVENEVPCTAIHQVKKLSKKLENKSKTAGEQGIAIITKDFRTQTYLLQKNKEEYASRGETFKILQRCAAPSFDRFFAFKFYKEGESTQNKKKLKADFSLKAEYSRLGVPNDKWRLSDANSDFSLCSTYPLLLCVPASVTDEQLKRVALFRSRGRLPTLSWIHPENGATITRCSQPCVGMKRHHSKEDEAMLTAILQAGGKGEKLYILDSRPKANATANSLRGGGYEGTRYKDCEVEFQNVHNIHVMRESLKKVAALCASASPHNNINWKPQLEATGWLGHVKMVLGGAKRLVDLLNGGNSCLVHCSDGWDRTAQISSLAQITLDPFCRTLVGFITLIEKEWLSFGHKFSRRLGHGDRIADYKDSQRAPIFLQFLDACWQIVQQFNSAFEFNEQLLMVIADSMYSCLYGTFLFECVKERTEHKIYTETQSIWVHILNHKGSFLNPLYTPTDKQLDISVSEQMVMLWQDYHLRWNSQVTSQPRTFATFNFVPIPPPAPRSSLEAAAVLKKQKSIGILSPPAASPAAPAPSSSTPPNHSPPPQPKKKKKASKKGSDDDDSGGGAHSSTSPRGGDGSSKSDDKVRSTRAKKKKKKKTKSAAE